MAIISLTLIIFLILSPISIKAVKSQKALSELQPKIQEIQKKYKDDKEKQAKATMELYQKAEINPFKGCLPLLLQMPVLITLFLLFKNLSQTIKEGGGQALFELLYPFVSAPSVINTKFLGLIELTEPSMVLALFAGAAQFFQTKMLSPKYKKSNSQNPDFSHLLQKQMIYFFPFLTVVILWKLSSAIALYWITTSLLSISQQYLLLRKQHAVNN